MDVLHSVVFFQPEAGEKFGKPGTDCSTNYFAGLTAPMGAVPAKVVVATFYNFNPRLVAGATPAAWELGRRRR